MELRTSTSVVARETGVTTTFGLKNAEERAILFIGPGVDVYEGMVVEKHSAPTNFPSTSAKRSTSPTVRNSIKDIEFAYHHPKT